MKKINFKILLISTFVLYGIISLFFIFNTKVLGQSAPLQTQTLGCSVKTPTTIILQGHYINNPLKKPVTTYFRYKNAGLGDSDFNNGGHDTSKYEPANDGSSPESNYFYQTPGLIQPMSVYYFQAVSYFNDDPQHASFGEILTCDTHMMFYQGNYYQEQGDGTGGGFGYNYTSSGGVDYSWSETNTTNGTSSNILVNQIATTSGATVITLNSATLNGVVNVKSQNVSWVYFDFISEEDYKNTEPGFGPSFRSIVANQNPIDGFDNVNVSVLVEDLEPGTTYYYRVVIVENFSGRETRFGSTKSFKTLPNPVVSSLIKGVKAPKVGDIPVTKITETDEYTGTVTWSPNSNPFIRGNKPYIATIRLTPKQGYTLSKVPKDYFNVDGLSIVNVSNSFGSGVVKAVFNDSINEPITKEIKGVLAPMEMSTPVTKITETDEYTGTVTWSPKKNFFVAGFKYTATINLTPKPNFTFASLPANYFLVEGAEATNNAGSGVVKAVFPGVINPIVNSAIKGIIPPATGARPVTKITPTNEYTGTVDWSPDDNTFASGTVYTATITLTPKTNYTLDRLFNNYFSVEKAEEVSYNAGTNIVTAIFPKTADFNSLSNNINNSTNNTDVITSTINSGVSGTTGLIPCGTQEALKDTDPTNDNCEGATGWNNLMKLINNIVDFILFRMAIPIAAIMFAYAGILLLTAGGDTNKAKKAKTIFLNVALGIVIAAAAWLIINTILTILGYDASWIGFDKIV
ncbi:MAG: pilin [Candidatus Paceibacterota bacterium]